jgi:hypothetical protein
MINLVFNVDYKDTERLLDLAQKQSCRSMESLVKKLIYYAGESAVKLIPPGKTNLRNLPPKYKIRKEVKGYVRAWNKKLNRFTWLKATPQSRKIPGAGAAKAGFVHALRDIGNSQPENEKYTAKLGYGRLAGSPFSGYMGMLVDNTYYAAKIGSGVPAKALAMAEKRLIGNLWREEKKKIEGVKA